MSIIAMIQGALGLLTLCFAAVFASDAYKNRDKMSDKSWTSLAGVGFVANFFDTLGIGSFAPTTAAYRALKLVPDRVLPGTLNVSTTIPVVFEALIFMTVIKVDPMTLILMVGASIVGAVAGASLVARMPEKKIQMGMGVSLIIVAFVFVAGLLHLMPVGGDATELVGTPLIIGVVCNLVLGALMTIGIGLYAPCMALVYALGMSPKVAFPIMMASCAFLEPAASIKFVKSSAYDIKASVATAIFGSFGVFIAAYIVKELPLEVLKWVVVVVVLYTGISLIRTSLKNNDAPASELAEAKS